MFNISFNELALVALFAIMLLKPKDFPILINGMKDLLAQANSLKSDLLNQSYSLTEEIKNIENDINIIPNEDIKNDQ